MIIACSTCYALEKQGSTALEWEDAAAFHDGDAAAGVPPRYAVADGATEAYDAIRWVEHLVASFVASTATASTASTAPALSPDGLREWFGQVQQLWQAEAPTRFATLIEQHKFATEGSFATFLGCALTGLDGPSARWEAVALGDTVLFHVRAGALLTHFPPIGVDEFGLHPDGISTRPDALGPMLRGLALASGEIRADDVLFVATDALAEWLLVEAAQGASQPWPQLLALTHDAEFAALIGEQRAAGLLRNDDVTLLRIRLVTQQPETLVVCL